MLGPLLAFASAAMFGLNSATMRRAVLTGTVLQGLAISVPLGVPIFFFSALAAGSLGMLWEFSGRTYFLLICAGIIHFAFGRYCNYRATKAMGANLVRPVQQLNIIMTLALAIWLLDETLTPLRIFGIFLIVLGPIIMLRDRKKISAKIEKAAANPSSGKPVFDPNFGEGYFFAFLMALAFGSSAIFIRAALYSGDQIGGVAAGMAGGVISYGAAAIVILLVIAPPKKMRQVTSISGVTAKWFFLSAVFIGISQLLRFMALSVAPVSVVAPIQQTTAVFQIIFAWFINREHEAFGIWVLLGILLSLLGALALSVSTEFVISHIDLPDSIIRLADWRWP